MLSFAVSLVVVFRLSRSIWSAVSLFRVVGGLCSILMVSCLLLFCWLRDVAVDVTRAVVVGVLSGCVVLLGLYVVMCGYAVCVWGSSVVISVVVVCIGGIVVVILVVIIVGIVVVVGCMASSVVLFHGFVAVMIVFVAVLYNVIAVISFRVGVGV